MSEEQRELLLKSLSLTTRVSMDADYSKGAGIFPVTFTVQVLGHELPRFMAAWSANIDDQTEKRNKK